MDEQDIIEKKPSSPVATSLLAIAAACLLGGMAFQGIQVKGYTVDSAGSAVESAGYFDQNTAKKTASMARELLEEDK